MPEPANPQNSLTSIHEAMMSHATVIVVNHNGGDRVMRCLESLLRDPYADRQILVVDNASTDESANGVASFVTTHPEIALIRSSQNLGYAGGVNLALGSASGEYIAVLNMDVVVEPGWLESLIAVLETNKGIGAVTPLLALADGTRINAAGQDVHVSGLGFNRRLGRPLSDAGQTPFSVSGIQGAGFVIRRELLERIGGMDPSGFLYHEDVNLSWLLRLMGFDLCCVPASVVRHDYFLSMYPEKLYLLERNRWTMLLAYLHGSTLLCLTPALILTEAMMWSYCFLRGWAFMRAKVRSYRWVWSHRDEMRRRRRLAESVRQVSDWQVLRRLRWSYAWSQFLVLGRERGASQRRNIRDLPDGAM